MQLGAPAGPGPLPPHVAAAVRDGAARLGHRPAITLLLPSGRQEQSGASLAQWTAKGAHFLEVDLGLGPGDRLHLDAPLGWNTAAVALAAWWAGIAITLDPADTDVTVAHIDRAAAVPTRTEVFWLGDGIDGAPSPEQLRGAPPIDPDEAWVRAVQPFPDQPPPAHAADTSIAVVEGRRTTSQAQLLELAISHGGGAPLGLHGTDGDPDGAAAGDRTLDLALLCLRPLWCSRPTVVVRGLPRSAAEGDRVTLWR
jgi:uncharacterized protein (TIGR03089 family)